MLRELTISTLILLSIQCLGQTAFTGDYRGGRLWYKPTNFSVGSYSAHAVCGEQNQLFSWGSNAHGELGYSGWNSQNWPKEVHDMDSIYYYSAGYIAGAVKRDGTGWVWGKNFKFPTRVIDSVRYVDAGQRSVTFIKKGGTVWSVGTDFYGSFGTGVVNPNGKFYSSPQKMKTISNAVRVANGYLVTLVLTADGNVYGCGDNSFKGVSSNKTSYFVEPVKIEGLSNIVAIAASRIVNIALDSAGDVYVWGYGHGNWGGQMRKLESVSNIVAISARNDGAHFLLLDSSGYVYSWGHNYYSQLATGSRKSEGNPVLVASDAIDILAGESFSYIVKKDMSLWAAGSSKRGSIWLTLSNTTRNRFHEIAWDEDKLNICRPQYANFSNFSIDTVYLCYGDTVIRGEYTHYEAGTYIDSFQNSFGFDSLCQITIILLPQTKSSLSYEFCLGEGIEINGKYYDEAGHYSDILINSFGCDSIIDIYIKTFVNSHTDQSFYVCAGEHIKVGEKNYGESGLYSDTLANSFGCDSVVNTTIHAVQGYLEYEHYTICPNEIIQSQNTQLRYSGEYVFEYNSIYGCDSITTISIDTFKDHRCHPGTVFIPSAFTPNGDQLNDVFSFGGRHIAEAHLSIYSRWGELLYKEESEHPSWDGSHLGESCAQGVYSYVLRVYTVQGKMLNYSGTIMLFR